MQLLKRGPFPNQVDPWVESGRYFRQIHADLSQSFLSQYHEALLAVGYIAGLDWTLQSGEHNNAHADIVPKLYLNIEVSVPDLKSIFIREMSSGNTVTIIEFISPYSKIDNTSIQAYSQEREHWINEKGTQFVEIDLTRSENRLNKSVVGNTHSYNVTVHVKTGPRVIFIDYGKPLPQIALPLHNEVIPIDLQTIYDAAYQQTIVAAHMLKDDFYTEANLPFPSLITDLQIREAAETVSRWREELKRLQLSSG